MLKAHAKRCISLFLTVVIVLQCLTVGALAGESNTCNPSGNLTIANQDYLSFSASYATSQSFWNNGSASVSLNTDTITMTATGHKVGRYTYYCTNTLTLKNNKDFAILVSYVGNMSSGDTFTCPNNINNGTVEIAANSSCTFSLRSTAGTAQATATIQISQIKASPVIVATTFRAASGGSYTISYAGESLAPGNTYSKSNENSYVLTASPDAGRSFYGWYSSVDGKLSNENQFNYEGSKTAEIWPVFVPQGSAMYGIQSDLSVTYPFLDQAIEAAGSSGTIIVLESGIVCGSSGQTSFTIPNGVTLLLPYASGQYTVDAQTKTDESGNEQGELIYANKTFSTTKAASFQIPDQDVTLELTVPSDVTINVASGAKCVVGGTICSNAFYACGTGGDHANVRVEGTLNIQDGGILSACGYILGNGKVNGEAGSQIYQPFTIMDYRGGGYTTSTIVEDGLVSGETAITPFVRYTMQNIQSNLHLTSGANMYGYCSLYTQKVIDPLVGWVTLAEARHNVTTALIIGGASDNALLKLSSGATLDAAYDGTDVVAPYNTVGKTTLTINGGAEMGYLSLPIKVLSISKTVTTNGVTFPIPYNYEFNLNGEGSTYNVGYALAILPGATVRVGAGATLNVGNNSDGFRFVVYDGLYDHTASGSPISYGNGNQISNTYPITKNLQAAGRTGTGDLIVNGTLNINTGVNFGGVVQAETEYATEKNYPKIVVDSNAQTSATVQVAMVGTVKVINSYNLAGATVRTLTAQVIDTGTGKRINMVPGMTYYSDKGSDIIPDYTYTLYTDYTKAEGTVLDKTETLNAAIEGSWYNYDVNVYMVLNGTIVGEPLKMRFAHNADVSSLGYFSDLACTNAVKNVTSNANLYCSNIEASIQRGSSEASRIYYPTLRNGVQDAQTGETVRVEKDLTITTSIALDKQIRLDINGKTIAYTSTPFVNEGNVTLDLNGGTITNEAQTTVDNVVQSVYASGGAFTNNVGGVAVIDLNGGSIVYGDPGTNTATQAILNRGTLTIKDTGTDGSVTSSAVSTSGIASAGAAENYAVVVRNVGDDADLTVENATLVQDQATNNNSVGIVNHNGARITSLTNASISCPSGYAIFNLGGKIDQISGGSISGRWGIFNRNIRTGNVDATTTTSNRYTVSKIGLIGTIKDATVEATYQYALWNGGVIDTLGGTAKFTVTTNDTNKQYGYAVFNSDSWYYDTYNYRNYFSTGNSSSAGERVQTYLYDQENRPTIHTITDDVVIEVINASSRGSESRGYALENRGVIDTINGNAKITTYANGGSATYSNIGLNNNNGGYIGEITGNVVIQAGGTSLRNDNGNRIAKTEVTREYWQETDSNNKTSWKYRDIKKVTTYADGSTIQKISGNVQIIAEKAQYAVLNYRHIGEISENVVIRTDVNSIALGNWDSGGLNKQEITYSYVSKQDSTVTKQYTQTQVDTYNVATIDSIGPEGSHVLIQAVKNADGLRNRGLIKNIGSGATIQGTNNALRNGDASHYLTRTYVQGYYGTTASGNKEIARTKGQPIIEKIEGATIQATSGSYGINNYGLIKDIKNTTISATSTCGINNESVLETNYNVEYSLTWDSSASKYTYAWTSQEITYSLPKIELIGDGNTITATESVIYNKGTIVTLGGDGAPLSTVTATTTGSSGVGVYNLQGQKVKKVETNVNGTATEDTAQAEYGSASIGTVKSIQITGRSRGIQNGDGNTTYSSVTISELTDGLIATATATKGYGVYNADSNAVITLISGGDFKGGTNDDSTLGRDYAIYKPDNQTYPEGKSLTSQGTTENVTFGDGTTGTGYYFISAPIVAQIISADGSVSGQYSSIQEAVGNYGGAGYIKMIGTSTEQGFALSKTVYLDLNGQIVTLTSELTSSNDDGKLYGMDFSVTDYTNTPVGKLNLTGGSVAPEPVAQSPKATDGTYQRYVAIPNDDGSYSFHPFNISVTGYRFELNSGDGLGALLFQATFRGSETVENYLADTNEGSKIYPFGFILNDISLPGSITGRDSTWNTETKQFESYWRGYVTKDSITTSHTAVAWVKFKNDGTQLSEEVTLTYLEALQNANDLSSEDVAKINAFLLKLGVSDQITT